MDPEGTPDPSDGYQLLDKVRLVDLELCELIRDEEEMGQGFSCFPVFKFLLILVDMIDFKLSEEPFPTVNLRIDGSQRPHGLSPIQVGDGAQEMGQVLEEVGHSPTLVVDEEKSHIVRVEVDSQTQDIGLDSL